MESQINYMPSPSNSNYPHANQNNAQQFYTQGNSLSTQKSASNYRPFQRVKTPEKTEWALLNSQRARQYEEMKMREKQMARKKRQQFKQELDNQLFSHNNSKILQKEEDRRYSQFIKKQQDQAKTKQQKQKLNRMLEERRIQQLNQELSLHKGSDMNRRNSLGTSLNVGTYSDYDIKMKRQENKRSLVDALDQQMHLKQNERKIQKMEDMRKIEENLRYQEQLDMRNKRSRSYQQNPNIYEYYKQLNHQRRAKQKDLEHRLIDQVQEKKRAEQKREQQEKKHRMSLLNNQIKSVLDDQIKFNQQRRQKQKRINPQDHSYISLGGIFRDKQSNYNKRKYFQQLQKQAQEQKNHKQKLQYMSDEEYRYNFNQLHKAINGNYAFDKYIDRSVNAIGLQTKDKNSEKNKSFSGYPGNFNEHDAEIVRMKMQEIKQQQRKREEYKKSTQY